MSGGFILLSNSYFLFGAYAFGLLGTNEFTPYSFPTIHIFKQISSNILVQTGKLIFPLFSDTNQALRLCLGNKTTGAEFGAISALSINHDCSRLLCGFAKGQVNNTFRKLLAC